MGGKASDAKDFLGRKVQEAKQYAKGSDVER